jgi:ABC-type branched-subunit amino acid transport system substrate-binding protein
MHEGYGEYAALTAVRGLDSQTAVLGPSGNGTLWAASYQTSGNRMLVINCCSDSPDLAISDHIFRMEPNDSGQAAALVALAAEGADHVIIVHQYDEDSRALLKAATDQLRHQDARVSWILHGNDTESAAAITEAVQSGEATAAVLLYPEAAGTIRATAAPHVAWYGMDAILDESDLPEGTTAVRPGHRADSSLPERLDIPPVGKPAERAHQAYDAVLALGAALLAAQNSDVTALVQSLPRISEAYPDVLGHLSFDQNGDLVASGYTIWRMVDGTWTEHGQTSIDDTAE